MLFLQGASLGGSGGLACYPDSRQPPFRNSSWSNFSVKLMLGYEASIEMDRKELKNVNSSAHPIPSRSCKHCGAVRVPVSPEIIGSIRETSVCLRCVFCINFPDFSFCKSFHFLKWNRRVGHIIRAHGLVLLSSGGRLFVKQRAGRFLL